MFILSITNIYQYPSLYNVGKLTLFSIAKEVYTNRTKTVVN